MKVKNLVPKRMFRDDNWQDLFSAIDDLISQYDLEKLNTFLDHIDISTATIEDSMEMLEMVGFVFDYSLTYDSEYIKKLIESYQNRVKYKTTTKSYKAVLYSLSLKGNVYPMVEENDKLLPLKEFEDIADIHEYLQEFTTKKLTSHIYVEVDCAYSLKNETVYYYFLPEHHYPLSEPSPILGKVLDLGYNTTLKATDTFISIDNKKNINSIKSGETCYYFSRKPYISTNWTPVDTQNFTISMWVARRSLTQSETYSVFFGGRDVQGREIRFGFSNLSGDASKDNKLFANIDSSVSPPFEIDVAGLVSGYNTKNWNLYQFEYLAFQRIFRVYVNTVLVYEWVSTRKLPSITMFIGAFNRNGTIEGEFIGYINDVRIYNSILSSRMKELIFNKVQTNTGYTYGNFGKLSDYSDIRKFYDKNLLLMLKKDVSEVKKKSEVAHTHIYFKFEGKESKTVQKQFVIDKIGNILPVAIESVCTSNFEPNKSTPRLDKEDNPYKLDQTISWTLDVFSGNYIDILTTVKLGQALGVEVSKDLMRVESPVITYTLSSSEKKLTNSIGTEVGKYSFIVDVEPDDSIEYISEIGIYDINDKLVYYIKTPPIFRIPNIGYRFEIDIIRV